MGQLLRSSDMTMLRMIMQRETAHDAVEEFGHLGILQFNDLAGGRNAFQRQFANEIKRCDELERRIRFLRAQCKKNDVYVAEARPEDDLRASERPTLNALEALLEGYEKDILEINSRGDVLRTDAAKMDELSHVLERGRDFFSFAPNMETVSTTGATLDSPLLMDDRSHATEMNDNALSRAVQFVTGLIPRAKVNAFERIVFRATRGNSFVRSHELEKPITDPVSGESVAKNVFVVFFHGSRLRAKIAKLCESYGATIYPYPENASELKGIVDQVRSRMRELTTVLDQTNEQRRQLLGKISISLEMWALRVTSEKAIFHIMNLYDWHSSDKTVTAEAWVPEKSVDDVQRALARAERSAKASVGSIVTRVNTDGLVKPTYFETSDFTRSFQEIVDAYGMARYKEINPGVFTVITFPFLFAIMFGDTGHGILLFLFALLLLASSRKLKALQARRQLNEIVAMIFEGRYVLVLMSLFSIYVGFLYNDWFALSFDFFGTSYKFHKVDNNGKDINEGIQTKNSVYPIGIDPAWYETTNKLTFYNSLKMKMSVLFGVTQMLVGVCLGLLNMIYNGHYIEILLEFIPMFVFLAFTFGYMCVLIVVKWNIDWVGDGHESPSLLQTMTDFFLSPGTVKVETFSGQAGLQAAFLLIAFAMVPVLLLGKPYHEKHVHKKLMEQQKSKSPRSNDHEYGHHSDNASENDQVALHSATGASAAAAAHGHGHGDDEEGGFNFGDVMVKQMIHTIEYVLGCISNTASYLRLWALSLAHAQLSEVFWNLIFLLTIKADPGSGIITYVGFSIWASVTVGVLLGMESLSAFLHALRLHWVEFQNKFYAGDGIKFVPFSFKAVHDAAAEAAASEGVAGAAGGVRAEDE
jgi:V-type H+-transporting ATPase subunit a